MARTNNVQNRNKSVPIVSFLFNYFASRNMKNMLTITIIFIKQLNKVP